MAEGSVLFYTTTPDNVANRTADAFPLKYGIKAVHTGLGGMTVYATTCLTRGYESPKLVTSARKDQIAKLLGL